MCLARGPKACAEEKLNLPHLKDALDLARMTGLRLGDLVRLDWSDVGEKANRPDHPQARRPGRDPDLAGAAQPSRCTGTPHRHRPAQQPEGFDRTIHDLRGTYVTFLAMKGLTDEEIARIVGWTAKRVSEIRARYVDEARVIVSLVDRLTA